MKIAVLSNVNMNILIKRLSRNHDLYQAEGYGNHIEELLNPESAFNRYGADLTFIILDGNELKKQYNEIDEAFENLQLAISSSLKVNPNNRIFVSNLDINNNFVEYSMRHLAREDNERWIKKIISKDIDVFDLLQVIENLGRESFYSDTLWYLSSCPMSEIAIKEIANEIDKIINSLTVARKKCLILDMDNTLWAGVLGEDGPMGIKCAPTGEGAAYYDFQKNIKAIKELGIILVVSSKNNMDEVNNLYEINKSMPLQKEDFAIIKANWNRKSENIKEIAQELNIGLDSMVFIDDNPAEREEVKIVLPEVIVPDFPKNIYNLNRFLKDIYNKYFFVIKTTDEDRSKTKQYTENAQREEAKSQFSSYEEYLDSLEIEIDIREVRDDDIERAAQMTQKTNQFNLTTRRYTESDINKIRNDSNKRVLIGEARDKFGDYGKVILAIYEYLEDRIVIDSFLMSCRTMGRNIETKFLEYIIEDAKKNNKKFIEGIYIETKKNKPVENFYNNNGFKIIEDLENERKYLKELS